MKVGNAFLLALLLTACTKTSDPKESPFEVAKGTSWEDIKECCQIEKTAMVVQNVYALKLVDVPKPDPRLDLYYVHLSRKVGVFGITAGTEPIPLDEAHKIYADLVAETSAKYGPPSTTNANDIIWNRPPSSVGLFRITISKKDEDNQGQVSIFYIYDNNETYS